MGSPPDDARAYTLLPHWAHAVAHLGKPLENRNRPIPPHLVGQRVAIHAGATLPRGWIPEIVSTCPTPLYAGQGGDEAPADWCWTAPVGPLDLAQDQARPIVTRAIVATAVLRGSVSGWYEGCGVDVPEWADPTRTWWYLADVITLATPVPVARGQLGPWRLAPETIEAVDAAGGWG